MPSLFFADLVRETSVAVGAGPLVLGGAVAGHRRFADVVPGGASFHYSIAGVRHAGEWEVGTGTLDAEGRLSRDVVAASSNGGALVAFSSGVKTVALTVGAGWLTATDVALAAATAGVATNGAALAAAGATIAAQGVAIGAAQGAIAGKQPISTGHGAATHVEAADSVTLR
ncbi:hypothetical protein, partial [Sphingopyxis sp. KK2]|uniref:hypothetical protein n=1 Tax=Sphingopyxis sp. KK2 TaxID=1855727 RepID=UPI001C4E276A